MKNTIKKTEYAKNKLGFTIVETLVAIAILTIALTGPLAIVAQSLRASFYARDQVTAYYLAQEAIEFIRNKRDNNSLTTDRVDTDWLEDIRIVEGNDVLNASGVETAKLYLVKATGGYQLKRCGGVCPNMKYADPSVPGYTSFLPYGQDDPSLPVSKFTREIILNRGLDFGSEEDILLTENREIVVTVRVKWVTPSGEKNVIIRENLFNWQIENFD